MDTQSEYANLKNILHYKNANIYPAKPEKFCHQIDCILITLTASILTDRFTRDGDLR